MKIKVPVFYGWTISDLTEHEFTLIRVALLQQQMQLAKLQRENPDEYREKTIEEYAQLRSQIYRGMGQKDGGLD